MESTASHRLIIVVCNGNIHRSVIAQLCLTRELFKRGLDKEYLVISRGIQGTMNTDPPAYSNLFSYPKELAATHPWLKQIGIEIPPDQRTTPVDEQIVSQASLILAMDKGVLRERTNSLIKQFEHHTSKMRLFMELVGKQEDVPDCGGSGDPELHRQVVMSIHEASITGFPVLLHFAGRSAGESDI